MIERLVLSGSSQTAMSDAMLSEFRWIHMQRNRNILEKKSPSHFILQKNGLRRFGGNRHDRQSSSRGSGLHAGRARRDPQRMPAPRPGEPLLPNHLAKGALRPLESLEVLCIDRLGVQFFPASLRHAVGHDADAG
jgi:hypothetical protein